MSRTEVDVFITKYDEFCSDLTGTFPELTIQIAAAKALSVEEKKGLFRAQVLPSCSPTRSVNTCPTLVLPGVSISPAIWETLSEKSRQAIQEYLTVLSFCILMETSGSATDISGAGFTESWAKSMMDDMKDKMKSVDFSGFTEKFSKIFGAAKDISGGSFPQIPEKFMKGQIARLAEEIVKEFNIEDFGIDPKAMEAAGSDPSKALQMVMDVFMKNPAAFQGTIMKLTKKLQQKIQSGSLRPQELVAEAEELMKTFSENPQFVELMESFRSAFGMEGHEDELKASGRDGSARLSIVQQRLRKKLDARKAAASAASASASSSNHGLSSSNAAAGGSGTPDEYPSPFPQTKKAKGGKR
jgi:hypothetical protein